MIRIGNGGRRHPIISAEPQSRVWISSPDLNHGFTQRLTPWDQLAMRETPEIIRLMERLAQIPCPEMYCVKDIFCVSAII